MIGESANAWQVIRLIGFVDRVHYMLDGVGLGQIDYNLQVTRQVFELFSADIESVAILASATARLVPWNAPPHLFL